MGLTQTFHVFLVNCVSAADSCVKKKKKDMRILFLVETFFARQFLMQRRGGYSRSSHKASIKLQDNHELDRLESRREVVRKL